MDDVELVSILLNLCINGIDSDTPSSIDKLYAKYDKNFNEFEEIKVKFESVMHEIATIYEYLNGNVKCFTSKVYFYTLFATLLHQLYGIDNLDVYRSPEFDISMIESNQDRLLNNVVQFENDFYNCLNEKNENNLLYLEFTTFEKHHRTRTTNKTERTERIKFLSNYLTGASDE